MSNRKQITVRVYEEIALEFPVASGQTILPGTVAKLAHDGTQQTLTPLVAGDEGTVAEPIVVKENGAVGKTVSDSYAENERALCVSLRDGDEVQMILSTSETIAVNDLLTVTTAGKLIAPSAGDNAYFKASEAVTTTTAESFIIVRKVPTVLVA